MTVMTATKGAAPTAAPAVALYPPVSFPDDPALPELPGLYDPSWIWDAYEQRNGWQEVRPQQIRVRELSHNPGRTAQVSYEAEWSPDDYLPSQVFTIRIERGQRAELFQYPEDRTLPGLAEAAHPDGALRLLNRHVLAIPARRVRVELVRYRPASRAVLRHRVGKARFYARAMRPDAVEPLLAARNLVGRSTFVVPRLAGHWRDGAVLWMSEIPGRNLRQRIRAGRGADPGVLLDAIESLWDAPHATEGGRPFNLAGAYRRAKRSFRDKARDDDASLHELKAAMGVLNPFVESWEPSGIAHNDFYDDQMLVLPDGRIALVDFEEAGPGDPLLDVGNFLAHLRWASHFGRRRDAPAAGAYHADFRQAALDRFGWNERGLALREAVCLFRVCTNAIRHPRQDWRAQLREGLSIVNETLA